MKELGIEELSLEYWAGMWAPAGTPADVVERLNAAINEALQIAGNDSEPEKARLRDENWLSAGFRELCRGGNSALGRGGEGFRREKPVSLARPTTNDPRRAGSSP